MATRTKFVISVDAMSQAVHEMVDDNITENLQALAENLEEAAESAADELRDPSAHNQHGDSPRGRTSMSGGYGTSIGTYSLGWKVYGRYVGVKVTRVVANANVPSLTHLLEFGHKIVGGKGRSSAKGFVKGDKAIENAYKRAKSIALGGGAS